MPRKSYWVYLLGSRTRVLYIGVTNDLARRVAEHRGGDGGAFTKRYNVHRLVYAEEHADVRDAIRREKQIKGWKRGRKVALIEAANPAWRDLADPEVELITNTEADRAVGVQPATSGP